MRTPGKHRRWVWMVALGLTAALAAAGYWGLKPSTESLLRAARTALEAGDAPRALEIAKTLHQRDPHSPDGLELLVEAGFSARDREIWEPASPAWERAHPRAAFDLWVRLGSREMQRFHAAAAEEALRRAIAVSADRPEPWRLLAQLVSIQGRPQETSECLLMLIQLGDFSEADLLTLAWPNSAVHDPARVDALLTADPANRVPMLSRVGAALNENRAADAEAILRDILAQHGRHPRTIAILGRLLAERNAAEFLTWQRELSRWAAEEPEAWIAQGIWLRTHGQIGAAARAFRQAFTLDPRHVNVASELGLTLQALGEREVGGELLEWARRQQETIELARRFQEQNDPRNTRNLIERLEHIGRWWEAWGWCRVHLAEHPQDGVIRKSQERLRAQLTRDIPRTAPHTLPGQDFDWSALALAKWESETPSEVETHAADDSTFVFSDVAATMGLTFQFENGPARGQTIVQTSGGGVAAIDFDRDGWPDLYFTQGGADPTAPTQSSLDSLFRNRQGRRFEDVTGWSRIHEDRFSQGIAAGDVDNDGFADLYVANLGINRLLRNQGDGTFSDVTATAGFRSSGWTTSAAIADLDFDGNPEIFSVRYATGGDIATRVCRDSEGRPGVCRPTLFPAEPDLVAVNLGDGRFQEGCGDAGLDLPEGRGFGLVVADFNDDGRPDVFVANDQTANFLHLQGEPGAGPLRFVEEAVSAGVAFDREGFPQACMGVASADLNGDGRPELFVTNFADESDTLYVSQPNGGYLDETRRAGLRDASFRPLGFGAQFLDGDLDGSWDLVVLNGHIRDFSDLGQSPAQVPLLFRGLPDGRFHATKFQDPQAFFNVPRVGRGLCTVDWNRDGLPDFAGSYLDGAAVVVENRSDPNGHSFTLELVGVQSSRDAIGTRVKVVGVSGKTYHWQATAGDGFAASNERRLHVGLGRDSQVSLLEIHWPSGIRQEFANLRAGTPWIAIEGRDQLEELRVK
ncbi:MAG: FG-GAP-like repeat-containing protein [Planctomycetaceae bacterium]|nr:FG-GAP-like repeat-containing protein [Planctomycetaceae bacterium]